MNTVHTTATEHHDVYRIAPPVRRRRRLWPIVLVAAVAAGVTALLVSNYYEEQTIGQRLDSAVAKTERSMQGTASAVAQGVQGTASVVVENGARGVDRAATALADTGITTNIKTALAADPALSALKIDVQTQDGVVTLTGPAPDETSKDRATVLASAPPGVSRVDNQLVVTPR